MRFSSVYITTKDVEEARVIAKLLLQSRMAACVNIVNKIESIYRWKGKILEDKEALLIVKTRASLVNEIIEKVKSVHSYECPCIVAFPILTGNQEYLDWIKKETQNK
ncbi:divalent-cation tolerance protein CutA [Candidatus Amoebophilus asiaticus]|nr:divalent-cation tolerance protein CutA [Candidatus Amoebophilus asiaticus]